MGRTGPIIAGFEARGMGHGGEKTKGFYSEPIKRDTGQPTP